MSQMTEDTRTGRGEILALTTEIVSTYLANNAVEHAAVAGLIQSTFATLNALANKDDEGPVELTPAVPIKKSITEDYIICLEDGKKLKMLKRYLMTMYGMTPDDYRTKWGLKADYPMIAPGYARRRRDLAFKIGLGRKREAPSVIKARAKPAAKATAKPRSKRKTS